MPRLVSGLSIPYLDFFHTLCILSLRATICGVRCSHILKISNRRKCAMADFVRGLKVTTVYGDGIIINLPIFNRITVRYADGTVRYFFPADVECGRIRPAAA